jgi:hypothetical protein
VAKLFVGSWWLSYWGSVGCGFFWGCDGLGKFVLLAGKGSAFFGGGILAESRFWEGR